MKNTFLLSVIVYLSLFYFFRHRNIIFDLFLGERAIEIVLNFCLLFSKLTFIFCPANICKMKQVEMTGKPGQTTN